MTFVPLLRAAWLAPFGGERRLLAVAEARLGMPPASVRVYAGGDAVSNPDEGTLEAAAVSFLLAAAGPLRSGCLRRLVAGLEGGGTLVVLDHNAPRNVLRRGLAAAELAVVRPLLGDGAARRLRYPAARELDALGLSVERLRLLAGERFQAILARKPRTG